MRPENFDVQTVIDYLQGTCNILDSAFGEAGLLNMDFTPMWPNMESDDLTEEDHNQIDNQIFLCNTCGWWCESGDQDDENNCRDCQQEDDEE